MPTDQQIFFSQWHNFIFLLSQFELQDLQKNYVKLEVSVT